MHQTVNRIVYGAEVSCRLTLIAYMVGGHVLFEGVPGTGKTLFARTFAQALGLSLGRIQCTPDLMPGDVIGANIFDFRTQTFTLTQGPVFTELLLADEINRTPPKTQSALLEAMQERTVTIGGVTHPLSARFTVLATQNPIEHEGTYPLPEAQLDRFLFKLVVSYPAEEQELAAVMNHGARAGMPTASAEPAVDSGQLDALRAVTAAIRLDERVARYIVALARATREHPALAVGLSPRAATNLAAAARAAAALEGREFVIPDDVKHLFLAIANHRVVVTATAEMQDIQRSDILQEVVASVAAPH
ncbi:MAG: MoxR family ATPase [Myxococcota bacterium]